MEYQRARTREQIEERRLDILAACDRLFEEGGYESINIKAISEMTTIKRSSIYTYYKTKDEMILDSLCLELLKWQEELCVWSEEETALDRTEFSRQFTKLLLTKDKMLQYYCLLYTVLEKNCSVEKLVEFKRKATPVMETLVRRLMHFFSHYSVEQAALAAEEMIAFIQGAYPASHLTKRQMDALEKSGTGYQPPDFEQLCEAGIRSLLA